ncbi:hypothetical protein EDC01DRAFT_681870 [Geopyxis carbonaria]|nr:hypothetical protein EDC01DRAFT_681870 [Geopyxis carbonaria]
MGDIRDYTTTSTGHQVGSGISRPVSWHKSRQAKLNTQFKISALSLPTLVDVASTAPADNHTTTSHNSRCNLQSASTPPNKDIFANCSIYISGSTAPTISDHSLKLLLSAHGAHISTILKRKSTTHIIVGYKGAIGSGAGGGLAAKKLHSEISGRKINRLKYVNVQWALDSVRSGKRLSESRYSSQDIRGGTQKSLVDLFGSGKTKAASEKKCL